MRALVTGGTGFIGAAVVRALLAAGWQVRALVRPGADTANLDGLPVERATGELGERAALRSALAGADALFHLAAAYTLASGRRARQLLYRTNVEGTRALMEEALAAGVPRIVYTSSVAVLAPPAHPEAPPADERSEPVESAIVGPYKHSKYLADRLVRAMVRERGLPAVLVLPSAPIGPRDRKPTPTGRIVLDFLCGRMPAYLDTGLNVVDVDDCARGHLLALERGVPGERYILGGQNLTLRQILEALAELTGLPAPRVRLPYAVAWTAALASEAWARLRGGEPRVPLSGVRMARKYMWFDSARARSELGFAPSDARRALARAARWYCEHGYVPHPRAAIALAHLGAEH
ncbi:MAG: dihydroflavonol-4-reductase [Planctomycetota bacterium]|nr:MAG: dihydroflavonol-4-reductase [Planctomycetota bacterium]